MFTNYKNEYHQNAHIIKNNSQIQCDPKITKHQEHFFQILKKTHTKIHMETQECPK